MVGVRKNRHSTYSHTVVRTLAALGEKECKQKTFATNNIQWLCKYFTFACSMLVWVDIPSLQYSRGLYNSSIIKVILSTPLYHVVAARGPEESSGLLHTLKYTLIP